MIGVLSFDWFFKYWLADYKQSRSKLMLSSPKGLFDLDPEKSKYDWHKYKNNKMHDKNRIQT